MGETFNLIYDLLKKKQGDPADQSSFSLNRNELEASEKEDVLRVDIGAQVRVGGWIKTGRDSKNLFFVALNDGSCFENLQIVFEKEKFSDAVLAELKVGACIEIHGILAKSGGSGQEIEILAQEVKIWGESPVDYPLQKKRHSFEFLRTIAHLRPRSNTFSAVFRVRSLLSQAIHRFFGDRHFVYIHTPIITATDAEGAGEMFRVTTLENGGDKEQDDFFKKKVSLTVSGQLALEPYALSFGRAYTFGPTFRAENSHTVRHLAEFWMVEPEMAFCDLEQNRMLAEKFLKYLIRTVLEEAGTEMKFFDEYIQKGIIADMEKICTQDFEVLSYTEAIKILEKVKNDQKFENNVFWGADLKTEHERYLAETFFKKPVVLVDYPKEMKAFYMRLNDDGKTVRAMDILFPRLGELIGGSQREERLDVLEGRMKEMKLPLEHYQWYLDTRRYGGVYHSGFGLGLERLVQVVSGMQNIRDVIPYPRTPGSIDF